MVEIDLKTPSRERRISKLLNLQRRPIFATAALLMSLLFGLFFGQIRETLFLCFPYFLFSAVAPRRWPNTFIVAVSVMLIFECIFRYSMAHEARLSSTGCIAWLFFPIYNFILGLVCVGVRWTGKIYKSIHLSTLLVMSFSAAVLLWANSPTGWPFEIHVIVRQQSEIDIMAVVMDVLAGYACISIVALIMEKLTTRVARPSGPGPSEARTRSPEGKR